MRGRRLIAIAAALSLCISLVGCASKTNLTFIADGGSYSADSLQPVLSTADLGNALEITTDAAPEARTKMLAQLRQQGDEAIVLANTLTSDFPVDVAAVPVVVESVTYEGEPAWIVIEAWGDEAGTLTHRRLWVFSKGDQSVLAAQSQE